MQCVLDASALVAYLRNEACGGKVAALIGDDSNFITIHAVNLSEVYYLFAKNQGQDTASQMLDDVRDIGIEVYRSIGDDLIRTVGHFKVTYDTPLADSYAAATARILGGTLVTKDLKDFSPLAESGECQVNFIIDAQ